MRLLYAALIVALLCLLALTAPALADRAPIEVSPVASLDGGPAFGACLSYPIAEVGDYTGWFDAGTKRADDGGGYLFANKEWMFYARVPLLEF